MIAGDKVNPKNLKSMLFLMGAIFLALALEFGAASTAWAQYIVDTGACWDTGTEIAVKQPVCSYRTPGSEEIPCNSWPDLPVAMPVKQPVPKQASALTSYDGSGQESNNLLAPNSVDMRPIPSGSFSLGFPPNGKGVTNKPWANVDWDETLANRPQYSLPAPSPTVETTISASGWNNGKPANTATAPWNMGKTGFGNTGKGKLGPPGPNNGPPMIPIFTCKNGWGWMPQAGSNAPILPNGGINGGPGTIQWTGSWNKSSLYK